MRPWLSIVAFAFSIGAAMAEDLPPAVQKAIAENKRDCKTVAIEKGFITRKDINGDGRPDFVLDYESFICDGNPRAFCGSIGCLTQVFASLPNGAYAKVFDDNVRRIDFREVQGRPAIVVGLPGFACGKDPTEVCEVVKSWNGSSFVDMPAPSNEWNGRNQECKIARSDQSGARGSPRHVRQGPNGTLRVRSGHAQALHRSIHIAMGPCNRANRRYDRRGSVYGPGGELGEFAGRRHYCGDAERRHC